VLEAVEQALFGDADGEAAYEAGGAQFRFWRALARPLARTAEGERRAVLILRDETDVRRTERMRADFLANASHELRTPLASLAGFIESLQGHAKDDPDARERFLGIMSQQAWRMSRLIDDLLSLSRIEMNEHVPPLGVVDLRQSARDLMSANAPLLAQRSITIDAHLPAGPLIAPGDRDQVAQVLQNLCDNALKYSPTGGTIELTVSTSADVDAPARPGLVRLPLLMPDDAAQGRFAMIRVSDQGPGISRQHLPRLSERFYRVEGGRTGTGLGLAIVKHIVNRHRGAIVVESAEGFGASFSVYFPLSG
jgi:two-component system phosphate regulon sensor histidine kinase PhoR